MVDAAAVTGLSAGEFHLRPMTNADWQAVHSIYAAGIDTGNATFETAPPNWAQFDVSRLRDHRWVAETIVSPRVVGWVAASPTSTRTVYRGVVEHSVYVDPAATGAGVGRALLRSLIESTERAGIWTIQSGIFPENSASLALHKRMGFRVIGRRERIGRDRDHWRDVLLLERRSPTVG